MARIEEGALACLSVEALVRVAIVMGCAVTDIAPELGQRLEIAPSRDPSDERRLWRKKEPVGMAKERRHERRRKAAEWLWVKVVSGGGRVRSDQARADYRDELEPWGRAAEVLHRARCDLGLRLVQHANQFGWWWETDHPLTAELPPLAVVNDRVGRREFTAEG